MTTTSPPIIVEQVLESSRSKVWEAITDSTIMRQWFFENIPYFEAKVGFSTEFLVRVKDKNFTHQWEVVEIIPSRKLVLNWKYKEYSGDSYVAFVLDKEKRRTKLSLITTIVEDFPNDIEEFKRESCEDGWKYFINTSLKDYLNN